MYHTKTIIGPPDGYDRKIELLTTKIGYGHPALSSLFTNMVVIGPAGREGINLTPKEILELIEELHLQLIAIREGE